jgi:hypothetical protein
VRVAAVIATLLGVAVAAGVERFGEFPDPVTGATVALRDAGFDVGAKQLSGAVLGPRISLFPVDCWC